MKCLKPIASALAFSAAALFAQDDAATPKEKPAADGTDKIVHGTKIYDAETIKDLYKEYKEQNEKRAEQTPLGLNIEDETVQLKALQVEADRIREERALREKLDPNPRRRLERLAELDPDAANELRVTMRNDEAFMSGERDPRPMGAGAPATFDQNQLAEAISKVREALGKKGAEEEAE